MKKQIIISTALLLTVIAMCSSWVVKTSRETVEVHQTEIKEDTRPLYITGEILTASIELGATTTIDVPQELSVQPKEQLMYPVHEYTEAELKEQEYDDSLELLAICVEAEAGNQDLLGKRLVVDVVLNRVDSDDFPNDITAVITQPYQFTSYTDGHMDAVWFPSEETYEAVRMELEHRYNSDVTFFTEGYYNPYCIPAFQYGSHYFGY